VITLNTDSELDDVLAMHALFSQVAPVKFEIFVQGMDSFAIPPSITPTVASSIAGSVTSDAAPRLTTWRLDRHDRTYENDALERESVATTTTTQDTPLNRRHFGSEQSDDVSLIELEDGMDSRLGEELQRTSASETLAEQAIAYPQRDLEEAARLQEMMDRLEAHAIDAPVFTSSLLGDTHTAVVDDTRTTVVDESMESSHVASANREGEEELTVFELPAGAVATTVEHYETLSSKSQKTASPSSPSSPVAEFKAMRLEDEPAVMEEIVASAVGQHSQETMASECEKEEVDADADPAEQAVPATATASTSTSERPMGADDRALIEQFQLLIKEFQDVIQNNPQLVAIAGSILNKVKLS